MTNGKKSIFLLAAVLSMAMPFTAWADTKISSVSLRIASDIEVGSSDSQVDVITSSDRFSVDDVEVTNEPSDEWDDRDKPKITVTLSAENGYYFESGLSKSDVDLSGDDATVSSVSRTKEELTVKITLARLDGDSSSYDLDVSNLEWDESDGMASWDEAEDANKYEVRLYRGDSSVTSVLTTSDTSYDFSGHFTKSGDYMFKVRAVHNSSTKGDWEDSSELNVTTSEARDIRENGNGNTTDYGSNDGGPGDSYNGAWLKDDTGWWYCNADRSYPINKWQYINNYWYYFNEAGYMVTGWVKTNEKWYFCSDSGAMLTNTTTPDGYYVGADGAWQ